MIQDLKTIGLDDFVSLITSINISHWGNTITLECVYNPDVRLPYRLIFENCERIKLQVLFPEDSRELEADLIGFEIGEKGHKQPAIIYTDIFELIVSYETFNYEKTW